MFGIYTVSISQYTQQSYPPYPDPERLCACKTLKAILCRNVYVYICMRFRYSLMALLPILKEPLHFHSLGGTTDYILADCVAAAFWIATIVHAWANVHIIIQGQH